VDERLQIVESVTLVFNNDWPPFERDFDGVTMVLVPAGCFMMGSEDGEDNEEPVHEQCFDAPFWIDKFEVTNEQYGSASTGDSCSNSSSEADQPRNCVNWFEALEHCESRDARLPTEAEWEYAARGPDNLTYPWGNENEYDAAKAISFGDPTYGGNQTAPVGSRPEGMSWVGAYDMSGNVSEWTNTIYDQDNYPYPYAADDGRENASSEARRILRGGSFYSPPFALGGANRRARPPDGPDNSVGFRCVRPPSQ